MQRNTTYNSTNSTMIPPQGRYDQKILHDPTQQPKSSKRTRRRQKQHRPKMTQIEPMLHTPQEATKPSQNNEEKHHLNHKKHHDAPMTKSDLYFALDCEMVGVGEQGLDSAVARVTIVNWENDTVLDTFVQVTVPVTDFRTHISGVLPQYLTDARTFDDVRKQVETIIRGKILIGHALDNDLCALGLTHPWCDIRDTAHYAPYMQMDPRSGITRPRKLRDLCWERLGRCIQLDGRPHSPIEDSIAALDLYKASRKEWEQYLMQQQEAVSGKLPYVSLPLQQYDPYVRLLPPVDPYRLMYQSEQRQQQQIQQQQQNSSNNWFWRRPKSPPRARSVSPARQEPFEQPSGDCEEYTQQSDNMVSSPSQRSSWSFFYRRSRSSNSSIQPSPTAETEVSTDNDWSPDYTYLQETNWSQSFQIQEQGQRTRLGSEDTHWSQQQQHEDTWSNTQRINTKEAWQQTRSIAEYSCNDWGDENFAPDSNFQSLLASNWSLPSTASLHDQYLMMEKRLHDCQSK